MPELPEVETVRRRLESVLRGKEISEVDVLCLRLRTQVPLGLKQFLLGSTVSAVERTGKYLLVRLDRGTWTIHLGMSGRFLFDSVELNEHAKHDHLILRTACGLTVRYNDFRRFGQFAVHLGGASGIPPLLAHLGPDALSPELAGDSLFRSLRKKRAPIKVALLDQRVISGIGNIYACEILYWAGIDPSRPANSLSESSVGKLVAAIHRVLGQAIEAGGSTLRDYAGTPGELGTFHEHFAVFGRRRLACPRCESACVSKIVLGGRATYFCSQQQH